jgi:hypothetical protein
MLPHIKNHAIMTASKRYIHCPLRLRGLIRIGCCNKLRQKSGGSGADD